jgi:hypothetical protein
MTRWEYRYKRIGWDEAVPAMLQEAGEKGWELVIAFDVKADSGFATYIFKRPMQPRAPWYVRIWWFGE